MKKLGLDPGDMWVGSALSDPLGITCKPFKTIALDELLLFLTTTLSTGDVNAVIVGHPKTITGKKSEQTKKVEKLFEKLKSKFGKVGGNKIEWILWDERLSSKRSRKISKSKYNNKEERKQIKLHEHSIASAFILQSYLDYSSLY